MLRRPRLLRDVSSPAASSLRRAFRSAASLKPSSHTPTHPRPPPPRTRRTPPTWRSTTTPPSPAPTPRSPLTSSTAASAGASSSSPFPPSGPSGAARKLIHNPFKIYLGRGLYGECLAIRADGDSKVSHEIGLELSKMSAGAGLRPIGAVVFMQRGLLKICLRTTDNTTNTAEIAKAHGGGGKPSSSSFALRMDEFNAWTRENT
ncbi:hypothetical protein ZWY2020_052736 [Hordeum vulgare]|nr:hypothetical protein ZWY2020_052736 [Hordeum vulgare]